MSLMLEVRGLRKSFGKVHAVQGIDLEVRDGEIFGFLGPNGAGKTTLTKCVTGFLNPTSGSIRVGGVDIAGNRVAVNRMMGIVPDQYHLYDELTGRQNLQYFAKIYGIRNAAARIDSALHVVGMTDRADRKAKGYSHGMQQRICIAQAILHEPKLLILDEPTNGLDPRGAYELRELIKRLARRGTTVFLNSHVMTEVEAMCDRVAIVDKGRIVAAGTVADLRSKFGAKHATRIRITNPDPKWASLIDPRLRPKSVGKSGVELFGTPDQTAKAVATLVQAGAGIFEVQPLGSGLEQAFLELTTAEGAA